MSMLAERKVKQKWCLNPRNNDWSEDSNKFGQKLLEKMGWSKGQGLGPKSNGIVDSIKVPYKFDNKGMGYKETNDQWTEHDTNYNALLQSLSGSAPPEPTVKLSSLEKKSQGSKVRVHYKKFTRGKDLSRCSEKDLANIFGKKSFNVPAVPEVIEEEEQQESRSDGFSYNGGSMLDYFKKKLPNFGKNNGSKVGNNDVVKHESDEDEPRAGFGRKRKGDAEGDEGTPKKKKKEEAGLSNPGFDPLFSNIAVKKHVLNTIEEESEDVRETEEAKINGVEDSGETKKNRRKANENSEVVDVSEAQQSEETKKKRRKRKDDSEDGQEAEVQKNEETKKNRKGKDQSEDVEVITKKKHKKEILSDSFEGKDSKTNECEAPHSGKKEKKKKKVVVAIDNPNFDQNDDEEESEVGKQPEVQQNEEKKVSTKKEEKSEVAKKKKHKKDTLSNSYDFDDSKTNECDTPQKKKKKTVVAIDNPNFDQNDDDTGPTNDTYEVKRKKQKDSNFDQNEDDSFEVKRKKKKNKSASAIDNPSFDISDSCQNSPVNGTFEVKRKKKQKNGIENPNFDTTVSQDSHSNNDFEVKRKKRQTKDLAIDNPNFDISDCQNGYVDSNFEVKRKKKKKDGAVDNPSFQDSPIYGEGLDVILNVTETPVAPKSSVKRRKSVRFSEVNEERIIPNEDVENRNDLFDINSRVIADGLKDSPTLDLDEISKKLDGCQAEVENDINEAKVTKSIGTVGTPGGGHEKVPDGTKLDFKLANFGKSPSYLRRKTTSAKSSYKHLIKGDVIVGFNNTNLHEIVGYAVNK